MICLQCGYETQVIMKVSGLCPDCAISALRADNARLTDALQKASHLYTQLEVKEFHLTEELAQAQRERDALSAQRTADAQSIQELQIQASRDVARHNMELCNQRDVARAELAAVQQRLDHVLAEVPGLCEHAYRDGQTHGENQIDRWTESPAYADLQALLTLSAEPKEATRQPTEVFPPSHYIRQEMDKRGWGKLWILSRETGLSRLTLELILENHPAVPITPEIAAALGRAFGTCAERWLNFDRRWQKRKQAPAQAEGEAP